jgi:hypothetical protein
MTSVACLTHKYNRTSIIALNFYQCVPCPIVFSRFMKAVEGISHLGTRLWVGLYPWLRDKPCPPPNIILRISCMDLSFDWQLQLSIAYVARRRQRINKHSHYSCINRSRDMALHTCFLNVFHTALKKRRPGHHRPRTGYGGNPSNFFRASTLCRSAARRFLPLSRKKPFSKIMDCLIILKQTSTRWSTSGVGTQPFALTGSLI